MNDLRPPLWRDVEASDLLQALATPPERYRPVPWLAWTGELDWSTLKEQLATMYEQGIREFFVFPIYGMQLPYMSAAYFERVNQTLNFCRQHDMKCWILDECNWPSGTCAGEVLRDFPESKAQFLYITHPDVSAEDVKLPEHVEELHEEGEFNWGLGIGSHSELPGGMITSCDWANDGSGYLDLLSEEATGRFINFTHERYTDRLEGAFDDAVPGFFTDEPALHPRACSDWFALPYTDGLFEKFKAQYGYDLQSHLGDLVTDRPGAALTRCHYWRLIAEQLGRGYGQPLRDWCDRHGMALTGHVLGEETLLGHAGYYGDPWELLKHFTIPGMDLLFNVDGFNGGGNYDRRAYHLTCKYIHGVVRHSGGREMMSEAFGGSDWGINLSRQKRGFNYQAALGVTLLNDNSLITSIADFRK